MIRLVDAVTERLKVLCLLLLSAGVGWASSAKLGIGLWPGVIIGACIFGVSVFSMLKLRGAPREVMYTFGLKFFSVTAYKVLNVTLVLWLANDMGFKYDDALHLVVVWAIIMSVSTLLAGSIADALGLRRTLLIGVSLCVLTRLIMVAATNPAVALAAGLFPLAIGEALCTPVLVAALRRFTTSRQRSVAFSVFYAIMNFGFMVGYFVFDGVRRATNAEGLINVPLLTADISAYRTLLLVSMFIELLMIPLILVIRRGAEVTENGLVVTEEEIKYPAAGPFKSVGLTVRDAAHSIVILFAGLVKTRGFYRLLMFLMFIGFLKVVFNVMDYVLPPFAIQELGEAVGVGSLNAINGILILVLAPAIGIMTQKYSAYSMVILGGFITAFSFVFMFTPPAAFQGLADSWVGSAIGHGYLGLKGAVHPYYVMIAAWQIVFSLGEAFYSPRVYEYASSIAPKGQEASYASLSYVPLLIGKLITGAAFGGLLARYCPEQGTRNPGMMWLIIGLMVLVAPVGLLVFQRYIRVKEEGRE